MAVDGGQAVMWGGVAATARRFLNSEHNHYTTKGRASQSRGSATSRQAAGWPSTPPRDPQGQATCPVAVYRAVPARFHRPQSHHRDNHGGLPLHPRPQTPAARARDPASPLNAALPRTDAPLARPAESPSPVPAKCRVLGGGRHRTGPGGGRGARPAESPPRQSPLPRGGSGADM